jgi:hypothetical protein
MPKGDGTEEVVDIKRRDFLGKSGTLAAIGVVAHVAPGAAQGAAQSQEAAASQIVRQSQLQDYMLKAESAMSRIGKGIYAGLVDEVAAGAEDLEKALQAIVGVNIGQPGERQAAWKKNSGEAVENARKLRAAATRQKGDREISQDVVGLYSAAISSTIACHRTFRTRA